MQRFKELDSSGRYLCTELLEEYRHENPDCTRAELDCVGSALHDLYAYGVRGKSRLKTLIRSPVLNRRYRNGYDSRAQYWRWLE